MFLSRGARRSAEILCKRLSSPVLPGHGYSTTSCGGRTISELIRDNRSSVGSSNANANCAFGVFVRRYATECNWDLGKSARSQAESTRKPKTGKPKTLIDEMIDGRLHRPTRVPPSLNYVVMQYLLTRKQKMHFDSVAVLNHFVAPGVVETSTHGDGKDENDL